VVDDIKPNDISLNYSIELLGLINTMLSSQRDVRPTATEVRDQLTAIAVRLFQPKNFTCLACQQSFAGKSPFWKHLKKTGHNRLKPMPVSNLPPVTDELSAKPGLTIRGFADAPAKYYYDDNELDAIDPSPCMVCNKHFNTKRQFFGHLYGVHHYRGLKYVQKRKADDDVDVDKEDERLAKWIRKDIVRHD
jgi:hypothetical protein